MSEETPINENHRRCAICGFVVDLAFAAEKPTTNFTHAGRHKQARSESEAVALWIIKQGYATGHGDTVEDMLNEYKAQVESEKP